MRHLDSSPMRRPLCRFALDARDAGGRLRPLIGEEVADATP